MTHKLAKSCKTPFSRLLIANRGEIAIRILRAAWKSGYETVAVYSEPDAQSAHVALADQAVCIGGARPSDSYLNIGRIIDAALKTGADAIHPGYGFLAENEELATACTSAGIVFIGPSASSIANMGDKAGAKALMIAAGVPCVPGYQGSDQSLKTLRTQADGIGYPLMIKATAGGGGRGMRLVPDAARFDDLLFAAKSEAKSAFGSDAVLLERAIINPRHIEIQIMADRYGNVVHLGERDCSVQRRHQKLIEEAPSPAVSPQLRAAMGKVSTDAAKSIGYEGAGTFEYLLDSDGQFYFMEMNTRLQVEHPVTEAITGLDLVAMQLQLAGGEPLGMTQGDIAFSGHAIEVRLCAEDPLADFIPQSGRIERWRPSDRVRTEHGLADGAEVLPYYDSMIAKLITFGPSRDDARRKLANGLKETVALGIRTNQDFLAACLNHSDFAQGLATTGFIDQNRDTLLSGTAKDEHLAALRIAALLRASPGTGLTHGFSAPIRLQRGDKIHEIRVISGPHGICSATGDEASVEFTVTNILDCLFRFTENLTTRSAHLLRRGNRVFAQIDGRQWDFTDLTLVARSSGGGGSDGKVRASMNGTVVSVDVTVGDTVAKGQKLLVLEAMKMEHVHVATRAGTIAAIHVVVGAQVTAHAVVVEIDPAGETP